MAKKIFSSVGEIIEDVKIGKPVIVVDDESRENEGDLVIAAQKASVKNVAFMIREGRGLFCVPMDGARVDELGLASLCNIDEKDCQFTISVDSKKTSTGMSAADRVETVKALLDGKPQQLKRPGHVFPLRAHALGLLGRRGHTEAAVELARLGGLKPAGVICEIINDNGSMARLPALKVFAKKHGLKIVSVDAIARYLHFLGGVPKSAEIDSGGVRRSAQAVLPTTRFGVFTAIAFETKDVLHAYIALVKGNVAGKEDVLCRIHSECLTGDALFSKRCDCGAQLAYALELISKEDCGILIYLRQEGRGIGLWNKIAAYALQDKGWDTVQANEKLGFTADLRDYSDAAGILKSLKIKSVRLLTNNLRKVAGLRKNKVKVSSRLSIQTKPTAENEGYLKTKREKLGHQLEF